MIDDATVIIASNGPARSTMTGTPNLTEAPRILLDQTYRARD